MIHEAFRGTVDGEGLVHALVAAQGSPGAVLDLANEYPAGCENLLLQILEQLAERKSPPEADVVERARTLHAQGVSASEGPFYTDARFLVPLLSGLQKEELLRTLPSVLTLPKASAEKALHGFLAAGTPVSGVTPTELFIAVVNLPESDRLSLKHLVIATDACFGQRKTFTQEIMATILEKLVAQSALPTLLMRIIIKSAVSYPKLKRFIVDVLARLVPRRVWEDTSLWRGFKRSMKMLQPNSVSVLLRLPEQPLRELFGDFPELKTLMQNTAKRNPNVVRSMQRGVREMIEQ